MPLNFICQSVVFSCRRCSALMRSFGEIGSQSCRTACAEELRGLALLRCPNEWLQVSRKRGHRRPLLRHPLGGGDFPGVVVGDRAVYVGHQVLRRQAGIVGARLYAASVRAVVGVAAHAVRTWIRHRHGHVERRVRLVDVLPHPKIALTAPHEAGAQPEVREQLVLEPEWLPRACRDPSDSDRGCCRDAALCGQQRSLLTGLPDSGRRSGPSRRSASTRRRDSGSHRC